MSERSGKRATPAKRAKSAAADAKLSPTTLDVPTLQKLLSAAGSRQVSQERIEADLAAGAPRNGDGTINLVHYAAWLAREACGN